MIRVAVNGYGTIGQRVADAIAVDDDMEVVGVSKTHPSSEAFGAAEQNYPLYIADMWETGIFEDSISVAGKKLCIFQAVHQEAHIVVEAVDAIRAAVGGVKGSEVSIRMTDTAMGISPLG